MIHRYCYDPEPHHPQTNHHFMHFSYSNINVSYCQGFPLILKRLKLKQKL